MQNKTIIITGAAGEIGYATAERFSREGANIMLVDIDEAALQEKAAQLSGPVEYCTADVSKEADVEQYVNATLAAFGSIDMFFNNAGIEGKVMPAHQLDMQVFDQVMQVNVYGVAMGMKHVLANMANGGSIVITSSVAGLRGTPGVLAYTTSKHAVIGIMRTCALEAAERQIRVNSVHPGVIDSRMMNSLEAGMGDQQTVHEQMEQRVPLKRYGQEAEVADMVYFLLSEQASYCTGGEYVLDGGFLL